MRSVEDSSEDAELFKVQFSAMTFNAMSNPLRVICGAGERRQSDAQTENSFRAGAIPH
jgi:hypothetical protein